VRKERPTIFVRSPHVIQEELAVPVNVSEWQKENPWEPSPLSHPEPVPLVKPSDLFNPMLTIGEIMSPQAPSCPPDTPVVQAARILRDGASAILFVVNDKGEPAGYLTDRLLALALVERAGELERLTAGELMKREVPTVRTDDRLGVLLDCFTNAGTAVVDKHNHLVGFLRWKDLLRHLSERALGRLVVRLFEGGHSSELG
jgi:predicted transcriptional regulator